MSENTDGEAVAALYLAYFDRPAEPEDLDYWVKQFEAGIAGLIAPVGG